MPRVEYRQPRYLFERVMFWAMFPGLAAPVATTIAISVIQAAQRIDGRFDDDHVSMFVVVSYLWILLGSEILRSWLWLRHPLMHVAPRLPRASAVARAVILALTLAIPVTFLPGWPAEVTITGALVIALLAIYDQYLVLRRPAAASARFTGTRPRFIMWVSPTLAVITTLALIVGLIGFRLGDGTLATVGSLTLGALALPWTHPGVVLIVLSGLRSVFVEAPLWALAALVLINVVITGVIAASDASYQRAVNWFFRLKAPVEPPAPQ